MAKKTPPLATILPFVPRPRAAAPEPAKPAADSESPRRGRPEIDSGAHAWQRRKARAHARRRAAG